MRKICFTLFMMTAVSFSSPAQLLKRLSDKVTEKANQRATQKVDNGIDKGLDKTEDAAKKKTAAENNQSSASQSQATSPAPAAGTLKTYANYDFIPGDVVVFEDQFTDEQDGEFPSHWSLENGQGILNKLNGIESFYLTDGNYVKVTPLTKTKSFLTNNFTIEYDVYNPDNGAYPLIVFFKSVSGEDLGSIRVTAGEASCEYADGKSLNGSLPQEIVYDNFKDKWHHVAIAYKEKQIKVYVDQYRVLVVPNSGINPEYAVFGGIGDLTHPIIFKNFRMATGGKMNMLVKKFTDTKIVTHGINFDVNKSVIKPESMGTINGIAEILKNNPEVKFEIGGHTDSDGDNTSNQTLSQQRSDAVRNQLITMGVDASRLTAKGYGETKPIADNTSPEGKANNRRVEFVKK